MRSSSVRAPVSIRGPLGCASLALYMSLSLSLSAKPAGSRPVLAAYNYGIKSYEPGQGLKRFVLSIDGAGGALEKARARGLRVAGSVVVGPDNYEYELLERASAEPHASPGMEEPFVAVVLRAAEPSALAAWYASVLGMHSEATDQDTYRLTFPQSTLPNMGFRIEPTADGTPPQIEQWEGRNAIALPEAQLRAVNDKLVAEAPHLIIHSMRELHEKLGVLFILILRDVAGGSHCSPPEIACNVSTLHVYTRPMARSASTRRARTAHEVAAHTLDCMFHDCTFHVVHTSTLQRSRKLDLAGASRAWLVVCPAGFEVCLVSVETFDPSVREATDYVAPDWAVRNETRARLAGLAALDAARKRMLDEWQRKQAGEAADDDDDDDDDDDEDEDEEDSTGGKEEL